MDGGLVQVKAYKNNRQDTISEDSTGYKFDSVGHFVGSMNE